MTDHKKIIIAIDGFSSCGKSTMAKKLASKIGYAYIDTGAMYRAVALYCLRNGLIYNKTVNTEELERRMSDIQISFKVNESGSSDTFLNGENVEKDIRSIEAGSNASLVSAIGFVRRALVEQQRAMGKEKGIVMDGRDIGTVVFPDAELKIFVTASPEIRAQRRYDELKAKGDQVIYEEVLAATKERDERDMNRAESPLRQAPDALVLDNSNMNFKEQNEWLAKVVDAKLKN
jgi:cytidylate kinase